MGMEDFQFLLSDLAVAFREDALWGDAVVPGRFRIDPYEVSLVPVEPGLGVVETWFYCDRAVVPKPWPELGDTLTIRGMVWEIVQKDEDDIGEFGFRLIKQELGITTVTSEGVFSASSDEDFSAPRESVDNNLTTESDDEVHAGRPTRRQQVAEAFADAIADGSIRLGQPLSLITRAMRRRLGNGQGLSDRTLRRQISELVHGRVR
jgi:hypothetical protein